MRVLVTGGAGFIGSHLVESLLKDGHAVTILDNFDPFYPPALKRQTVDQLAGQADGACGAGRGTLDVVEGDIRAVVTLGEAFRKAAPDVVAHLAALAGVRPSCERPLDYASVNVIGTAAVLEAARAAGVQRFLFVSSSSVYGETAAVPFREDDHCGAPISPYAATKRAGELFCHSYAHLYPMRIISTRLFTVYGPRQRPDLAIYKFCRAISTGQPIPLFGDGSTQRDYTYVTDIVAGLRGAMEWTGSGVQAFKHSGAQDGLPRTPDPHPPSAGTRPAKRVEPARTPEFEVVNLGGARTTSLIDLVRHLERLLARPAVLDWQPPQLGDVPITHADTSRARALFGYEPQVSIEDGLARFVAWFQAQHGVMT
jgi:UDP-glucuronate 4-epimerase